MSTGKLKLVVFGIDSADWRIMQPYLDAGDLPNLAEILERGSQAALRSTIPPITAVAWPTAFTGTNPGKHGLFGFVLMGKRPGLLSNADRQRPALWELLSRAGVRVGSFLVPFTFPPDPVNGWMLCGTGGGQSWDERGVQPVSLYDELAPILRRYPEELATASPKREPEVLLQAWRRLSDWRAALLGHLLERHPVQVLMAVDNAVDVLQHKFLASRELADEPDMVRWAYRHADRMLGLIREHTDADTRFLLLSDHGAQPLEGYLDLSAWLCQAGYLRYRTAGNGAGLRRVALRLGSRVWRRVVRKRGASRLLSAAHALKLSQLVDWAHTRAFAWPGGGIIVNAPDRSPLATVRAEERGSLAREIAEGIGKVTNPFTGRQDLQAYLREELYEGPFVENAPDVVVVPQDFALDVISTAPRSDRVFWTAQDLREAGLGDLVVREGTHRREGILAVAAGGEVRLPPVTDLAAIAPTALSLLGLPIPAGMDGQSLVGGQYADEPSGVTRQRAGSAGRSAGGAVYTEEEEEELARRLADLGYL